MVRQVEKVGVEVRLGEEVAIDSMAEDKPDAVILAIGATPLVPDIPGIEGDNVVMVEDALAGVREVGDRVVIVGGGMVGCETAEFLHAKGKQVTILEMLPRVGDDIEVTNRLATMTRLSEAGIVMRANTKAVRITENGVAATSDGATEFFEGDTVVLAAGAKPRDELACELEGKVAALYSVGDCLEPRLIREAIGEAARAGLEV
jgi:2,4-dienoyl-CoA reductase (NADPH2)